MKKMGYMLGYVLFLCAVTLFLSEQGLRIKYGKTYQFTRYHPSRIFTANAGGVVYTSIPFRGKNVVIKGKYSSLGLHDREYGPKQPGERRIILLGDSFAEGFTQPPNQTISRFLEKNLGGQITVINMGTGGYGPWQERDKLNEVGWDLEPDFVILQLFLGNDIDNTLMKVGEGLPVYDPEWKRVVSAHLLRGTTPGAVDVWLTRFQVYNQLISVFKCKYPIVQLWNLHPLTEKIPIPLIQTPECKRFPYVEQNYINWYPLIENGWRMLVEDVNGIKEDCEKQGVGFAIFDVPLYYVTDPWQFAKEFGALCSPSSYDLDKEFRLTKAICVEMQVPCLDIITSLRAYPKKDELYWVANGHFTPKGAKRVADVLYRELKKNSNASGTFHEQKIASLFAASEETTLGK